MKRLLAATFAIFTVICPAWAGRTFDGSTDKLLSTSAAALTDRPGTICAWVRPDVTNATMSIAGVSNSADATPLYRIAMTSGGVARAQLRLDGGGTNTADGTTVFSTSAYQHVCGAFNSDSHAFVYYNGTQEGSDTATSADTITVDQTEVGVLQRDSAAQFWDGDIAEVDYWNVRLTDAEIAALAQGVSARYVRPGSLQAYYPVWGLHSPEHDLIGTLDLTVTGTTRANHAPVTPFTPKWAATMPLIEEEAPAAEPAPGQTIVVEELERREWQAVEPWLASALLDRQRIQLAAHSPRARR